MAGVAEVGRGGAELEPAATAEVALGAWVARVPAVGAGEEPPEEVPAGLVEREGAGVLWVLVNMDVTPGPVAAVVGTAGVVCVVRRGAGAGVVVPGAGAELAGASVEPRAAVGVGAPVDGAEEIGRASCRERV